MAYSPSTIVSISSLHDDMPTNINLQTPKRPDSIAPSYYQKMIGEIFGTYIFVFAGCGAALVDREKTLTVVGSAMVPGLALMAMIYAIGHISGAHFNPAVTIAFAAAHKLSLIQVPMYVLSQLVGSTLACLTLRVLFRHQADFLPMLTQYTPTSTTDLDAIIWEFILTFILTFTIFGVASDERANNALCGVAIGGALMFNILIGGFITGASMNPARSLGPAFVTGVYKNQWVYIVGPVLGGLAASLVYSLLRAPQMGRQKGEANSVYNDVYLHSQARING